MTYRRMTPIVVLALVAVGVMTMAVGDPSSWPPSSITWLTGPWSVNHGVNVTFVIELRSNAGNLMGNCDVTFSIDHGVGDVGTVKTGVAGSAHPGRATLVYDTSALPLAADTYTVTASFEGVDAGEYGKHGPSSADQDLTILCSAATWYQDSDGDTYGNPAASQSACDQPDGYVADNTDCDDTNPSIYPGAPELLDGKDNDCDGMTDEVLTEVNLEDVDNSDGANRFARVSIDGYTARYEDGESFEWPYGEKVTVYGYYQRPPYTPGPPYAPGNLVFGTKVEKTIDGDPVDVPFCDTQINLVGADSGRFAKLSIDGYSLHYLDGESVNLPEGASFTVYGYYSDSPVVVYGTPQTKEVDCTDVNVPFCDMEIELIGACPTGSPDGCYVKLSIDNLVTRYFGGETVNLPIGAVIYGYGYNPAGHPDGLVYGPKTFHTVATPCPDTFAYGFCTWWDDCDPEAKCKNITVYLDATGSVSIAPTDVDGGSTDNCSIASKSLDVSSFTCANLGDNTVTLTVEDPSGNTDSCTATVTVADNTLPMISCPGALTAQCSAPDAYADLSAFQAAGGSVSDNCGIDSDSFSLKSESAVGACPTVITRTYEIADTSGNKATCTQEVTVDDTISPTFTVPDDVTIYKDANCAYDADPSITGDVTDEHDNCDTSLDATYSDAVAAGSCAGEQVITRTWTLTDDCGNTTQHVQTITAKDNTPPDISGCPFDITQDNDRGVCGAIVSWVEPTVEDNCDPAPLFVSTHAPGDYFPVGTTTVTYTATDDCGNVSTCVFDVTVVDVEAPNISFVLTPPNPDYNQRADFIWTAQDNNNCTAPPDLLYRWRLDGSAWSEWLPDTSTTVGPLSEDYHTFEVEAQDEAGNVSLPISYLWYRGVYGVEPPPPPEGVAGGGGGVEGVGGEGGVSCFFDFAHCLAGGGAGVEGPEIGASYEVCEPITLNLIVTDDDGLPVIDAAVSATFAEIVMVDGEETYPIVAYLWIPPVSGGLYELMVLTCGDEEEEDIIPFPAGNYLVWVGLNDGTRIELRFDVTE